MTPCPRCAAELPANARFCPQCGFALAAGGSVAERRQVAVLFADVSGFTSLSAELDAEEVHRILSRYFELIDGLIEQCGGSIDKHIGDAVMGVFGAPVAYGNDTLRALRAACGVHAAMETLSAEFGRPLAAHVGVASGEVVAADTGSAMHRNYTVTGDAVNLAARLNEMARAGETVISDEVHRACASAVDAEPIGSVAIRGLAHEVALWRLRGMRTPQSASTALVGRNAEVARFRCLLDDMRNRGAGTTCLLRADPGMGKTRLAEEFRAIASQAQCATHWATVLDFGTAQRRDAAYTVFASVLGIAGDAEARASALDHALRNGDIAVDDEPFAADLLAIAPRSHARYEAMDNEARTQGKLRVLQSVVERAGRARPLVIFVEDAHWASAWVLACIDVLARAASASPCIVVLTTRREGDPIGGTWDATRYERIDLPPLANVDALALASTYLAANPDVALRCVERAEGNPLFLTQLLRSGADGVAIPGTIQSVVLARLDRLAPADKAALQAASVIGQRFSIDALRHLLDDASFDEANLVARDLVRRDATRGDERMFVHALIRDGAYASLLHSARRTLHLRAADWYAGRDAPLRAEHLDRADDPRAAAAYLDAARSEAAALRFDDALRLLRQAAKRDAPSDVRYSLAMLEGELTRDLGDARAAITAFERALPHAPDERQRCAAWIGIAAGHRVTATLPPAFKALDEAQALADAEGFDRELARIHYVRGNLHFAVGDATLCRREHEQALHFAERAHDVEAQAQAWSGLGDAHYANCRMRSAYEAFSRCVELCEREGLTRFSIMNHAMIAIIETWLGRGDEGLARLARARSEARLLRHRLAECMTEETTGWLMFALGQHEEAAAHLMQSLAMAREIGARRYESLDLMLLARTYARRGDRGKARELLREAWQISAQTGHGFAGAIIQGAFAACADDARERSEALAAGESLLRQGSLAHSNIWFYRDAISAALQARQWDEVDRYADRLAEFMGNEPMPWTDFQVALGHALADVGRGRGDVARLRALSQQADAIGCRDESAAIEEALAGGSLERVKGIEPSS